MVTSHYFWNYCSGFYKLADIFKGSMHVNTMYRDYVNVIEQLKQFIPCLRITVAHDHILSFYD